MRSRDRGHRRPEGTTELNLIPVMNLFVCLIPFLLMAAAFTNFGAIDAETPSRSNEESRTETESSDKINMIVQVDHDFIRLNVFQDSFKTKIDELEATFEIGDIESLQAGLADILEKHPSIQSTLFRVGGETAYEDALQVLGQLRQTEGLEKLVLATEVVKQ